MTKTNHLIRGQESKLGDEHLSSEMFPTGYNIFRQDRKSGGGGVFILVRDDILVHENAFLDHDTDCEIVWALIQSNGSQKLNLASVYIPPNAPADYIDRLEKHLKDVYSQFPNSIFLIQGDFNLSCTRSRASGRPRPQGGPVLNSGIYLIVCINC